MTIEENKALVRRFIDGIFVGGRTEAVERAPDGRFRRPHLAFDRRRQA